MLCTIAESQGISLMIDSGADVNVLTEEDWELVEVAGDNTVFDLNMEPETSVHSYASSASLLIVCTFKAWIRAVAKLKPETFAEFVVIKGGRKSLLGRRTAMEMKLLAVGLEVNQISSANSTVPEFPSIPGVEVNFDVDEFVLPMRHAYVNIPIHFREAADERLRNMQQLGIIEPASGSPRWISGMSAVPKGKADFRLIVNMRGPNKAIRRQFHQMPRVDEMRSKLNGSRYFTKLDLHSAFHHVKISERSRELTTFMAPKGMFQFKRLVFGVNCAPEIFQRIMERVLQGIGNIIVYIDDILVFAPTKEELRIITGKVLSALKINNLTLNNEKCIFEAESLTFLGHQLSERGMNIDDQKVKDVQKFREPQTASELKSFLGLASYVSSYIAKFADLSEPLWRVSNKCSFEWGPEQSAAFNALREAIINCTTSQGFFDTSDETFLYTDASPHAIGAVLSQRNGNGDYRIISFASKSLTPTERRYPQTQREALAVVWATEYYFYYLLGHSFTIRTDAQGIAFIFNRVGDAPKRFMRRAEGWAMRLDSFDFSIEYVKGSANIADPSSRLFQGTSDAYEEREAPCEIATIEGTRPVNMTFDEGHLPPLEVAFKTKSDSTLQAVMTALETGEWTDDLGKFKSVEDELHVSEGILMRLGLAVIPEALRDKALTLAHKGHPGITKTKSILRQRVWWPLLGKSVEDLVESCRTCQLNGRKEPPTPMERTRLPDSPWDFLAVDFCGPYSIFGGIYVAVVIDYYSRFMVAGVVGSTDFASVCKFFDKIFDKYGFPKAMKSDNGPPFNSTDYASYCRNRGIESVFAWPLTPQQNGMVERAMQTINRAMQAATLDGISYHQALAESVRAHNNAAHRVTNVVPSDLMFARKVRRSLPLASSAKVTIDDESIRARDWKEKQSAKDREDRKRGARDARIMIGDRVVLRRTVKKKGDSNYDPQEFEVTAKRKGDLTLTASNGRTLRRHITLAKKIIPERLAGMGPGRGDGAVASPTSTEGGDGADPLPVSTRVLRPRSELKKPSRLVGTLENLMEE